MFSRIASSAVKRLGPVRPAAGLQPTRTSFAAFSSAEVVPGIGRGKTSTGIVRVFNYPPSGGQRMDPTKAQEKYLYI